MLKFLTFLLASALVLTSSMALADNHLPGSFVDDDNNVHERNIEAIAGEAVTRGCNPPANHYF